MTITVQFEARCSFCPSLYSMGKINVTLVNVSKHQFVKQLRIAGWAVGKYTTCPNCTEAGKQRKKKPYYEWAAEAAAKLDGDAEI